MDVRSGAILKERIANTQNASPNWLADSSGFFYNQLTGKVNTPERYLDSQVRFHKVGGKPERDPVIMKRDLDPSVTYEKIQAPYIGTAAHASTALLVLADVRPEQRLFSAPLADAVKGKAKWRAVAGFEDEITGVDLHGDDLYLLSIRAIRADAC